MVLVSASFLSVSAEAVAQASVRLEKSTAITIDLPEGTLEASVALLAQQAGIAVAWLSPLPKAMVPRLRARLTLIRLAEVPCRRREPEAVSIALR